MKLRLFKKAIYHEQKIIKESPFNILSKYRSSSFGGTNCSSSFQYLEEYLEDLAGVTLSLDGGVTSMNFAEAAMLIQGSVTVYSKKVCLSAFPSAFLYIVV